MKFVIALYGYSSKPEDGGVARTWYCSGENEGARWTAKFAGARLMSLEDALAVYKRVDSPMRKIGLVPVE